MYEFIYFFAVIMYEFICVLHHKIKAASARKPQVRAASVQRKLQARCTNRARATRAARAKPKLISCPDQAAPGCPGH
jgi:hypothetical protein